MKKKKRKKFTWKPNRANYHLTIQKKEREKLKKKKKSYIRPIEIPGWIWDDVNKNYIRKLG